MKIARVSQNPNEMMRLPYPKTISTWSGNMMVLLMEIIIIIGYDKLDGR